MLKYEMKIVQLLGFMVSYSDQRYGQCHGICITASAYITRKYMYQYGKYIRSV